MRRARGFTIYETVFMTTATVVLSAVLIPQWLQVTRRTHEVAEATARMQSAVRVVDRFGECARRSVGALAQTPDGVWRAGSACVVWRGVDGGVEALREESGWVSYRRYDAAGGVVVEERVGKVGGLRVRSEEGRVWLDVFPLETSEAGAVSSVAPVGTGS